MKSKQLLSIAVVCIAFPILVNAQAPQQPQAQPTPQNQPNQMPQAMPQRQNMPFPGRDGGESYDFNVDQLRLTDDQNAKIKDLRIAHLKEVLRLKNMLDETTAHLNTMVTAETVDMKMINASIDNITQTQNQLLKSKEAYRQQIRVILTLDQRLQFDLQASQNGGNRPQRRMPPPIPPSNNQQPQQAQPQPPAAK